MKTTWRTPGAWSSKDGYEPYGSSILSNLRRYWWGTRFLLDSSSTLSEYYQLLSAWDLSLQSTNRGWVNLGYWKERPASLSGACLALAALLADRASIGDGHEVLDAGCGNGNFARFLVAERGCKRVLGLNVVRDQIELAQQRSAESPYRERIEFKLRDAAAIDLPESSVDRVTALECAFHFQPRLAFFTGAYRCLRAGGRIATADIVPKLRLPANPLMDAVCRAHHVPRCNWYLDLDEYRRQLVEVGFREVEIVDISEHVFAPFGAHMLARANEREFVELFRARGARSAEQVRQLYRTWLGCLTMIELGGLAGRYVIATARK